MYSYSWINSFPLFPLSTLPSMMLFATTFSCGGIGPEFNFFVNPSMDKIHIPQPTVSGWNQVLVASESICSIFFGTFFDRSPKYLGILALILRRNWAKKVMIPFHLRRCAKVKNVNRWKPRWPNSSNVLWVVPLPSRYILGFLGKLASLIPLFSGKGDDPKSTCFLSA